MTSNPPMTKPQWVIVAWPFVGHWGLVIGALILSGCHWHKPAPGPTSAPMPTEQWTSAPVNVPVAAAHPVQQGRAPLVYLVDTATTVRVMDATSGEELLKVPVPAHTIIAVNAAAGVQVGGATMRLGPLPADHTYSIYLESSEENVIRQGYVRPGG